MENRPFTALKEQIKALEIQLNKLTKERLEVFEHGGFITHSDNEKYHNLERQLRELTKKLVNEGPKLRAEENATTRQGPSITIPINLGPIAELRALIKKAAEEENDLKQRYEELKKSREAILKTDSKTFPSYDVATGAIKIPKGTEFVKLPTTFPDYEDIKTLKAFLMPQWYPTDHRGPNYSRNEHIKILEEALNHLRLERDHGTDRTDYRP